MNIAWTYLMHAYYRREHTDYRYYDIAGRKRIFHKTKSGANKHWELERCLNEVNSPLDQDTSNNLRFLIGLRHEIEHQMTSRIDNTLSAKFQACCLNYNEYVKKLFGEHYGIDKHLSISLQFSSINRDQVELLSHADTLPANIQGFVDKFEQGLSEAEYNSPKFAFRVLFVAKTANHKGQADEVIEFIKSDSELAAKVNTTYALIKETERKKFRPGGIRKMMNGLGFQRFTQDSHTRLWHSLDAKNPAKGFGTDVDGTWFWYESWVETVRKHCEENREKYT